MRSAPQLHPWIRGAATGALLGACGRAAASELGGSPLHLLGAAAALGLGLGLADALRGRGPGARAARLLALAPAVAVALLDPLLGVLGRLNEAVGLGIGRCEALILVVYSALIGLALLRARGGRLLGAALGLALGALVPPLLSAALAGVALALLPDPEGAPLPSPPRAEAGTRMVAMATLTGALTAGWLGLRAALDPTPLSAWILVSSALLVAAPAARWLRLSRGRALWAASLAPLAVWVGLGQAPAALDALARAASGLSAPQATALLALPAAGLGAAGGLLCGASAGGLRWRALGPALVLGVVGGILAWDRGGLLLPGLSGALALLLLVAGPSRGAQLGGLLTGAACFALAGWAPAPSADRLIAGRYAQLQDGGALDRDADIRLRTRSALAGWEGGVAAGVRAPDQTWSSRDQGGETTRALNVELDGLVAELPSRAAGAEAMAGLLGGLLAPRTDRALLLGDETGAAHQALTSIVARTTTAVPSPEALRAVAKLDPRAERAWLLPGALLLPAHPALALRMAGRQDAIVDIARAPWTDGARATLDDARIAAAARRLGDDGVYVLCLHLLRLTQGEPQAVTSMVLERFPTVQLWLPPSGADTLLIVASKAPIPLSRLREGLAAHPDTARALGLGGDLDLASLAVSDAAGARSWVAAGSAAAPGLGPSAADFARPVQHLSSLEGHTASPDAIWSGLNPEDLAALSARVHARASFLHLLGDAASGDLEAVFDQARSLLDEAGTAGSKALDPLLAPHLDEARADLAKAQKEGLSSRYWEAARAAAVTAQMLNPSSPDPLIALGDIALAQGNARVARQQYAEALTHAPDRPDALTGLARAWRLLGETGQAEDALRQATRAAPRNAAVWQNLGVFLLETGRKADAEQCLRRAAALDPSLGAPHLALAELALDSDDATLALVEAERALQLQSTGYAWYLRGRAHFALEQLNLAEQDFQSAVLADPSLVEARGAIGHIQALRGDLPAAAETFKAVLAQDPDNGPARENLRRVTELLAKTHPKEPLPMERGAEGEDP